MRGKYDADVAASNKRKQPDGPVDFEKLAQAAGSVSAVGGSVTSVKLSKLSIEFVGGIMGRFSLDGMCGKRKSNEGAEEERWAH